MTKFRRVTALALRFNWASKARFVLLTLIAAVGMTVFLIVSELSAVSSQGLKQSIAQAAGQTGTYSVDVATAFGFSPRALAARVDGVLRRFTTQPPVMLDVLPQTALDCPPGTALGSQPMVVVRKASGWLARKLPGTSLPRGTRVCLGGQGIPASDVRIPTPAEQLAWLGIPPGSGQSTGVVIAGGYERLALLSASQPVSYRFVLVTGRQADQSAQVERALNARFQNTMRIYGMGPQDPLIAVTRLDSAAAIRTAAAGVDLVYSVIAWGILLLGGLGLLVAEIIVVRDRTWFFGLSRAVGASGSDIATLIIADVVLVLATGTALALGLAVLLQPSAASFAQNAFQIGNVSFLHASTVPQLIIGELLILLLAGAYPAGKAVRQDPLDVLEPRVA